MRDELKRSSLPKCAGQSESKMCAKDETLTANLTRDRPVTDVTKVTQQRARPGQQSRSNRYEVAIHIRSDIQRRFKGT